MILLRDFSITEHDMESLVPMLSCFDYYFVVTLWPTVVREKHEIQRAVTSLGYSDSIFAEPVAGADLCHIGFHLYKTTYRETRKRLLQFRDALQGLAHIFGDKQLAGQNIGIYLRDVSQGEAQAAEVLIEIGKVFLQTLISNKFGNLSYPPAGRDIAYFFTDEKAEEILLPLARLSSNKLIYEFGEGGCSRQQLFDTLNSLSSLWHTQYQIHDMPDRDLCIAEFLLAGDTVATVGKYDSIENMNICTSTANYPKVGALALELFNEDKRKLPIIGYEHNKIAELSGRIHFADKSTIKILPLPKIEPFIKPRHVLLSFSHR